MKIVGSSLFALASVACREDAGAGSERKPAADAPAQPALAKVDAALPELEPQSGFRLTVRGGMPGRVDFDTDAWNQAIAAELAAEQQSGSNALARALANYRAEGHELPANKPGFELGAPTNNVYMPLFELLVEAGSGFRRLGLALGRDVEPALSLVVEPGVDVAVVADLINTATRAELTHVELLVDSPAGRRAIALDYPRWGDDPIAKPCSQTTLTITREGAFVSTAVIQPVPHPPTAEMLAALAAGAEMEGLLLVAERRVLLDPERRCPTLTAAAGVVELAALGQRLAELPSANRCPQMSVVFAGGIEWAAAAPVLAKLALEGQAPMLEAGEGWSTCEPGVRPGDPEFEPASLWFEGGSPIAEVSLDELRVSGALDSDIVSRIVRAHIGELRDCYDTALSTTPSMVGGLGVTFVIGAKGRVSSARDSRDDGLSEDLSKCVVKAVKDWTFPKPDSGVVEVFCPIRFGPL